MNTRLLLALLIAGGAIAASAQERPDGKIRERMMKQFDKDGDGTLSESERSAMEDAMEKRMKEADTDNDGYISDEERQAARRKAMLKHFDTDGDGQLSEEERTALPKRPGKRQEQ